MASAITELGTKVYPSTENKASDKAAQAQQPDQVTILLNKPIGYVSGQPEPGYRARDRPGKSRNPGFEGDQRAAAFQSHAFKRPGAGGTARY